MELKTIVRYATVVGVKGLLTLMFGISFSLYQPALAEAPDRLPEDYSEIQTLLDSPYLSDNFKLSEAQEIKYKLYLETQKQGLFYRDFRRLKNISFCESSHRQFDVSGDVLRGEKNKLDVGVFQVNEYYHLNTALSLGYNLYSLEGNIEYATYLYSREGGSPWTASRDCWLVL